MNQNSQGLAPSQPGDNAGSDELAPGQTIGDGRYRLQGPIRTGLFARQFEAGDAETREAVALHLLRPEIASSSAVLSAVLERAEGLTSLRNPSVCNVIATASGPPSPYVVTQPLEGQTLSEVLERRQRTTGGAFPPASALNLGAGIFGALAAVHEVTAHGAVTHDCVVVAADGTIMLSDLGLSPAVDALRGAGLWPADAPIAPEIERGAEPTAASDIYAAGALLYHIAVGSPPSPGCPRPSDAAPGLSREVDELVARCMLADPDARFSSAATVYEMIASIAEEAGAPGPASAAAPSGGKSLSQSLAEAKPPSAADEALSAALGDDDDRWLVTKDKLDYGPFTTGELVEEIQADRVLPSHEIIDKNTGERHPASSHPLFCDEADRARQRRDDRRRAEAEESHTVQERRRGFALYGFIGSGVLALAAGAYWVVGDLRAGDDSGGADVAALDEEAELEITSLEAEEPERPARRGGSAGGGASGGGGGDGLGYDDTRDLDMAREGGGGERLSNAQLNRTIQRHTSALGGCITRTGASHAHIEFIVRGDGRVSDVRVNGETSGALPSCISGVMRSMNFPTFDGDRTRGNFDIGL